MAKRIELWVSPDGRRGAAGTKRNPVGNLHEALRLMRRKRRGAGGCPEATIVLREGTHFLSRPLVIEPRDSGTVVMDEKWRLTESPRPLVLRSAPGERAVISGGRRIGRFRPTTVNGVDAWVASIPAVKRGTWSFTQLWVNGKRARRPVLPEDGCYRIARRYNRQTGSGGLAHQNRIFRGDDRFGFNEGELWDFHNFRDVDFVALHFWIESRVPLARLDMRRRIAELQYPTRMILTDDFSDEPAPYYLDNVFEALGKPGQWYLDKPAGRLYYVPREGESIDTAEVIAPVLEQVVDLQGDPWTGQPVRAVEFCDLVFSHNAHVSSAEERKRTPQAACNVGGAVRFRHAQMCAIRRCSIEHIGSYGVELTDGCLDCTVEHCRITDMAAGGVKVFHSPRDKQPEGDRSERGDGPWWSSKRCCIRDCHIHDGGHYWRQAVGVLIGLCSGIEVVHNHIHDLDYTGISVGWSWGYMDSQTYGNVIEWNHIHDIGRGVLSDMGAVYFLGPQPGTRFRFNHVHDVSSRGYGGWGVYLDEGSGEILIESNLVHDTKCQPFTMHYGRRCIVQNNIFAFAKQEGMIGLGRGELHVPYTFQRNIVVSDGVPFAQNPHSNLQAAHPGVFDNNLYYDVSGKPIRFVGLSLAQWRKLGKDRHSIVADPGFGNTARRDLRLTKATPAQKIGFVQFDVSRVGPRRRG